MSEINIKLKLNSDDLKRGVTESQGSIEKLKTSFKGIESSNLGDAANSIKQTGINTSNTTKQLNTLKSSLSDVSTSTKSMGLKGEIAKTVLESLAKAALEGKFSIEGLKVALAGLVLSLARVGINALIPLATANPQITAAIAIVVGLTAAFIALNKKHKETKQVISELNTKYDEQTKKTIENLKVIKELINKEDLTLENKRNLEKAIANITAQYPKYADKLKEELRLKEKINKATAEEIANEITLAKTKELNNELAKAEQSKKTYHTQQIIAGSRSGIDFAEINKNNDENKKLDANIKKIKDEIKKSQSERQNIINGLLAIGTKKTDINGTNKNKTTSTPSNTTSSSEGSVYNTASGKKELQEYAKDLNEKAAKRLEGLNKELAQAKTHAEALKMFEVSTYGYEEKVRFYEESENKKTEIALQNAEERKEALKAIEEKLQSDLATLSGTSGTDKTYANRLAAEKQLRVTAETEKAKVVKDSEKNLNAELAANYQVYLAKQKSLYDSLRRQQNKEYYEDLKERRDTELSYILNLQQIGLQQKQKELDTAFEMHEINSKQKLKAEIELLKQENQYEEDAVKERIANVQRLYNAEVESFEEKKRLANELYNLQNELSTKEAENQIALNNKTNESLQSNFGLDIYNESFRSSLQGCIDQMKEAAEWIKVLANVTADAMADMSSTITNSLSDNLTNVLDKTKSMGDAMKDLYEDIKSAVREMVAQIIANMVKLYVIEPTLKKIFGTLAGSSSSGSSSGFLSVLKSVFSIPAFADGGVVPGSYSQATPIIAHGSEMVINPSQQSALFGLLNGSSSASAQTESAQPNYVYAPQVTTGASAEEVFNVLNKHSTEFFNMVASGVSGNTNLRNAVRGV